MRVRALDANGDWTFGKGRNNYAADINEIKQNIKTRYNSFLGDCFFASLDGIDWLNLLAGKDQGAVNIAVKASILGTNGVISLITLASDLLPDRTVSSKYSVNTIFGIITASLTTAIPTNFLLTESGEVLTTESGGFLIS